MRSHPAGVSAREANDRLNEYVADSRRGLAVWHDHFVGAHGGAVVLDVRSEEEEALLERARPARRLGAVGSSADVLALRGRLLRADLVHAGAVSRRQPRGAGRRRARRSPFLVEKEERMTAVATDRLVRAASLEELRAAGRLVVHLDRHTLCLFAEGEEVYAVDNRCPHMGFPLHRGTVCDGILTCHWHHARFDLATGGTFDQFADELRRFPVEVDGDDVLVDLSPPEDPVGAPAQAAAQTGSSATSRSCWRRRRSRSLEADASGVDVFRAGLDFGVVRRGGGWFRGLTTLTCFMNLAPRLDAGRPRRGALPRARRRRVRLGDGAAALPARPAARASRPSRRGWRDWFRSFIEVRDAEGAERALVSAVRGGASPNELADMLFAAATDHRYLDGGHTLDFVNKALEALDVAGWERAEAVLASLPAQLAFAERMEEANAWRNPVDLVALLERAFARAAGGAGRGRRPARQLGWPRRARRRRCSKTRRRPVLEALLDALARGRDRGRARLGGLVRRRDADRPLPDEQRVRRLGHRAAHVHVRERRRAGTAPLAVARSCCAACSTPRPASTSTASSTSRPRGCRSPTPAPTRTRCSRSCRACSTGSSRSTKPGSSSASFLGAGGEPARLVAALGAALVREDRNFHTIQCVEAAVRQHELLAGTERRGAPAARRRALPRRACDHDSVAAADVRDRAAPPPRREALRGRTSFASADVERVRLGQS